MQYKMKYKNPILVKVFFLSLGVIQSTLTFAVQFLNGLYPHTKKRFVSVLLVQLK